TPDLDRAASIVAEKGISTDRRNGHLVLAVEDLDQLNAAIDGLRSEKVQLIELTPLRSTLEDVFVDLVRPEPVDLRRGGEQ
ncbi:MAG: hypothetical protein R3338_05435, partial [Thermoanaerobaculia bacterium]|nr:hypothetical protein [Thermoanaerobaculia bacterium]